MIHPRVGYTIYRDDGMSYKCLSRGAGSVELKVTQPNGESRTCTIDDRIAIFSKQHHYEEKNNA